MPLRAHHHRVKGHTASKAALQDELLANHGAYLKFRRLLLRMLPGMDRIDQERVPQYPPKFDSFEREQTRHGKVVALLKEAAAASDEEEQEEEQKKRTAVQAFFSSARLYCRAAKTKDKSKLVAHLGRQLRCGSDPMFVLSAAEACGLLRLELELDGQPLIQVTRKHVNLKLLEVKTGSSSKTVGDAVEQLKVAAQVLAWAMRTANPELLAARQLRVLGEVRVLGRIPAGVRKKWDGEEFLLGSGPDSFEMEVAVVSV